jgi:hypothetical protein
VKYFSEFSCLTPPRKYSRVKAGDLETYQLNRKYIVADQVFIGTENEKLKQA